MFQGRSLRDLLTPRHFRRENSTYSFPKFKEGVFWLSYILVRDKRESLIRDLCFLMGIYTIVPKVLSPQSFLKRCALYSDTSFSVNIYRLDMALAVLPAMRQHKTLPLFPPPLVHSRSAEFLRHLSLAFRSVEYPSDFSDSGYHPVLPENSRS